jgi:hypothetical protein
MMDEDGAQSVEQFDISVGISIGPVDAVEAAIQAQKQARASAITTVATTNVAAPTSSQDIAELANKIVQHAYNFLGSFITPDGKVPMRAFDDWWAKFKSRIAANPRFLEDLN